MYHPRKLYIWSQKAQIPDPECGSIIDLYCLTLQEMKSQESRNEQDVDANCDKANDKQFKYCEETVCKPNNSVTLSRFYSHFERRRNCYRRTDLIAETIILQAHVFLADLAEGYSWLGHWPRRELFHFVKLLFRKGEFHRKSRKAIEPPRKGTKRSTTIDSLWQESDASDSYENAQTSALTPLSRCSLQRNPWYATCLH